MTNAAVEKTKPADTATKTTAPARPDAPVPKPDVTASEYAVEPAGTVTAEPIGPGLPNAAVKPAGRSLHEIDRDRNIWLGLLVAGHSAAIFDAYTTRRAISEGYGTEGDPLLRPFSHSNAMYLATQLSPFVMDYLGHRMMMSDNRRLHKFWWLPQSAGTSISVGSGIHNYRIVPR